MDGGARLILYVQDEVVAAAKYPQSVGCTGGQQAELRDRFGGLRRLIQIAPPHTRKAPKLGITVCRSAASRASKACGASASCRKASMDSSRSKKLADSSTRYADLATLPRPRRRLLRRSAAFLQAGNGDVRLLGATCRDICQASTRVVDK